MKKLREQIKESFFNPVYYFLPVLIFMVSNDLWGYLLAWKISFPVAVTLIFYVYFRYHRLFLWYLSVSIIYLVIGISYTLLQEFHIIPPLFNYVDEIIFIFLMIFLLVRPNFFAKISTRLMSKKLPMANNLDEFKRLSKLLLLVVSCFTVFFIYSANKLVGTNKETYLNTVNMVYISVFMILIIYEIIRVQLIRGRLMKEDWVPIVNNQGIITGSNQLGKMFGQDKYMHPIVRMYVVNNGMILMKKNEESDKSNPLLWDTILHSHLKMGEKIPESVNRIYTEVFGINMNNPFFLANYTYEAKLESEYVFLFFEYVTDELKPINNITYKWWTPKQIEENIVSGIFANEFLKDYTILKRLGLLKQKSKPTADNLQQKAV